jgi:hypothetical protein
MSNELMKLIDDYAEWSAHSFWQDDQGYPASAVVARANKESARKAVVVALAESQADNERLSTELEKAQDEINCTEHSLEAFSCEFQAEVFNQGFDCLGDFVHAIWTESNKQRIALQAENEHNEKSATYFRDLFYLTSNENTVLKDEKELFKRECLHELDKLCDRNYKLRKENEKLVEILEGIEHFSDAVEFRNEPLSRAMTQWIKEGRAILAKRKENNNEDA